MIFEKYFLGKRLKTFLFKRCLEINKFVLTFAPLRGSYMSLNTFEYCNHCETSLTNKSPLHVGVRGKTLVKPYFPMILRPY